MGVINKSIHSLHKKLKVLYLKRALKCDSFMNALRLAVPTGKLNEQHIRQSTACIEAVL